MCVNKYDINEEGTRRVEQYCAEQGIDVVAKIPFDTRVTEAQVQVVPIVEYTDDMRLVAPVEKSWNAVSARLDAA